MDKLAKKMYLMVVSALIAITMGASGVVGCAYVLIGTYNTEYWGVCFAPLEVSFLMAVWLITYIKRGIAKHLWQNFVRDYNLGQLHLELGKMTYVLRDDGKVFRGKLVNPRTRAESFGLEQEDGSIIYFNEKHIVEMRQEHHTP